MNGKDKLLLDTNLFIYLLEGNENAAEAILDKALFFSFITEIELLGTPAINHRQQLLVKEVLLFHEKLMYSQKIGNAAIEIKQQR